MLTLGRLIPGKMMLEQYARAKKNKIIHEVVVKLDDIKVARKGGI